MDDAKLKGKVLFAKEDKLQFTFGSGVAVRISLTEINGRVLVELVSCQSTIVGYNRLSFTLAS